VLRRVKMEDVSWVFVALLAAAVVVLLGAEWPHIVGAFGLDARERRARAKRKANLKLLRSESEEFAASVQRDLSQLPTLEERDRPR
jgi:hypothetical protein